MIAKVHDLVNAEGSDVREYGLKRRTIPVYIRDCSKFQLALPYGHKYIRVVLLAASP
jgi:hypothetical protein